MEPTRLTHTRQAPDLVQLMTDGVRGAGADISVVADHLERVSYLTPAEYAAFTAALASVAEQIARARQRANEIKGEHE